MRLKDIAIFGVGGFGREVLALIKDINKHIMPPKKNFGQQVKPKKV